MLRFTSLFMQKSIDGSTSRALYGTNQKKINMHIIVAYAISGIICTV